MLRAASYERRQESKTNSQSTDLEGLDTTEVRRGEWVPDCEDAWMWLPFSPCKEEASDTGRGRQEAGRTGCCSVDNDNDNDNDNDTLRKVPHPSNEGLALQARVKGS